MQCKRNKSGVANSLRHAATVTSFLCDLQKTISGDFSLWQCFPHVARRVSHAVALASGYWRVRPSKNLFRKNKRSNLNLFYSVSISSFLVLGVGGFMILFEPLPWLVSILFTSASTSSTR